MWSNVWRLWPTESVHRHSAMLERINTSLTTWQSKDGFPQRQDLHTHCWTNLGSREEQCLTPWTRSILTKMCREQGPFEVHFITDSTLYAPNGLYQGTMNTERLQLLYQAYSKPAIFNSGQFPEAVAELLRRYRDGHKSQKYKIIHKYQIATPKSVLRALTNAFQITTELSASPLYFSSESTVYCSPYAEDTEFGAQHDAYSFLWKGSCFCHPEGTDEQLWRSVQWAIAYAQLHSEPLLVTFLLLDRPKSAFTSLLNYHMAKKLGTFSASTMGFQNGNSYATANQETTHIKHSSILVTIGNKEGYTRYFGQEKQSALEVALQRLQTLFQRAGLQQAHTQSAADSTVAPPKRLRRIVKEKETCSPITWINSPNRT